MLNALFSYGKQCLLFFYLMLLTRWTCKNYKERRYNIAEDVLIFQCTFYPCWQSSVSFEQDHAFLPSKGCCPSPESSDVRRATVPRHWHNAVLAAFYKGPNKWQYYCARSGLWGGCGDWHCFSEISDGFCSARTHVKLSVVMEEEHTHCFFLWGDLEEDQHSDFLVFYCRGQS